MSASGGQKQQCLAHFDFWRALVQPPFSDESQIWCARADHGIRLRAKFRLDRFILSPSGGEKVKNLPFWSLAFCTVINWKQSDKVEHGCTTANRPLANGIKIVSVLQRLHGEIGAQTLTLNSVADKQTTKQTNKKLNVFGHPSGG